MKYFADLTLLKALYYAFIQPHLQYGVVSWGGINITTVRPLILLQKRTITIRLVCNKHPAEHTYPLFDSTGILKFRTLNAYNVIIYSKKNKHFANLPVKRSNRLGRQYTYGSNVRSTRLLAFYDIHLVKLLNKLPVNILESNKKNY